MIKKLDKIKEVFLNGVDEEDYKDNLAKISEWETGIIENEALADWQRHDITKRMIKLAREAYKDNAVILATTRSLDEEERMIIFAKQDAIEFLLSLTGEDAQAELEQINKEIRTALAVQGRY